MLNNYGCLVNLCLTGHGDQARSRAVPIRIGVRRAQLCFNRFGQHFAEFDAPLIKAVNAPAKSLNYHFVFI